MTDRATQALLLLADGRFPAGGHAHSAGVEAAIADGRVRDMPSLEAYTRGRLLTTGLVDAALAATTVRAVQAAPVGDLALVAVLDRDAEAGARLPAAPLRAASLKLGRQLVRVAARCWPSSLLAAVVDARPGGVHLAVAQGAVAVAGGLDAEAVARLVVHQVIATPGQAAVKLLGLDPFEVVALAARLEPDADAVVVDALRAAAGPIEDLPALGNPLIEIAAMEHARWDVRMFAS